MAGFQHPILLELLEKIRREPTYPVHQRLGAKLPEWEAVRDRVGPRRVRVAVLSSFTIDPIKPYLRFQALERNVWVDVFLPSFNQFSQEILNPESGLYAFGPEVCFLHLFPEDLSPAQGADRREPEPAAVLDAVRQLALEFRKNSKADLVISNFALRGQFPHALRRQESVDRFRTLQEGLEKITREIPGVHCLDYESLTSFHGKEQVADERLRHIARMELSERFLPRLASHMLGWVFALRGFSRKCIVLDLDNTLWGGILGEEEIGGIHLGPEYPGSAFVEFQASLLELHRRGVLLAVNSKNNEPEALETLRSHPAMLLRPHHFAAMRINWEDKHRNLEAIAEQLNLGLDAFVFIDDNPAERQLMRQLRPEVFTPEWTNDPVFYRRDLESLFDFETASLTEEDRKRGEMYAAQIERETLRKQEATFEDYLFGLQMELSVQEAQPGDLPRVHQLFQKTNQFNLTTRRYSPSEVDEFHRREEALLAVMRNRDRFGDNGLVGVALALAEDPGRKLWRIDSLLMSCRVLGRTVESGFLTQLLLELRRRGAQAVVGEFIPTAKNELVKDFYSRMGFKPAAGRGERESDRWQIRLAGYRPPELPWLNVDAFGSKAELPKQAAPIGSGGRA